MIRLTRPLQFILLMVVHCATASTLPSPFVYLHDIDPSIVQDIRYSGYHNFVGRPIDGYSANECILTRIAAIQLAKIQQALKHQELSLKVYDCYRPTRASRDFVAWSKKVNEQRMKNEFYPNEDKALFFERGYVMEHSGHNRGSTVDLTIIRTPIKLQPNFKPGDKLIACFASTGQRFADNSIDMGTGFDCFDTRAYAFTKKISTTAYKNRKWLRDVMQKFGFNPYEKEWWHFTLANEPFPEKYFDFKVTASSDSYQAPQNSRAHQPSRQNQTVQQPELTDAL